MAATFRITVRLLLTGLIAHSVIAAQSAENLLLDQPTLTILQEELSGQKAKENVIAISGYHRIQGSPGYSDAARYVLQQLHSFGFRAWIESFPAEGRISYQTWRSPPGYRIESAELRMIQPENELIVSYPEIAMSVMTYSSPGHVRGELVYVGAGTSDEDYQRATVRGKLVLATGDDNTVLHRLAVLKYGAAALLRYRDDDLAAQHPDMLWYAEWQRGSDDLNRFTPGFNLTSRQGNRLKDLLMGGGRVVLDATIEGSGIGFGSLDVVVAVITGTETPEQELVYTAHLDHPKESANDNASGSAAILDIARSFQTLINEGKLQPPKRTLRFLWVPGLFGTMAYIDAHPEVQGPELGGNFLANLNLDVVGTDLELLHSRMNVTWTPQSISSVLTDVVAHMAQYVDSIEKTPPLGHSNFNYRITPFNGGSDHLIFNDGMIRIPSVMLGHWPDYTHNTSEDTAEKVDSVELERVELIAAASFWYLANLSEEQSLKLTNLVAAKAQQRLAQDGQRASSWLLEAPVDRLEQMYNEGKRVVTFALEREQQALNSVLYFSPFGTARRFVQTWNQTLDNQSQVIIRTLQALIRQRGGNLSFSQAHTFEERDAAAWIPSRLTRGPLAHDLPQARLSPTEQSWHETAEAQSLDNYLLVNFIDGRRTILDIRNSLVGANHPVSVIAVHRFIQDLAKAKLVELRRAN